MAVVAQEGEVLPVLALLDNQLLRQQTELMEQIVQRVVALQAMVEFQLQQIEEQLVQVGYPQVQMGMEVHLHQKEDYLLVLEHLVAYLVATHPI